MDGLHLSSKFKVFQSLFKSFGIVLSAPIQLVLPGEFFKPALADGFSLWQQVLQLSRTFLGILANLNNAGVCIVLILPLFFNSSSFFLKPFGTVPSMPIILVSQLPSCSIVFFQLFCFHSFSLCGQPEQQNPQDEMFFYMSGWNYTVIHLYLKVTFFRTDSGLCFYHLSARSNFNLLHNSQQITFPIQSYLVEYSFCASSLHSFYYYYYYYYYQNYTHWNCSQKIITLIYCVLLCILCTFFSLTASVFHFFVIPGNLSSQMKSTAWCTRELGFSLKCSSEIVDPHFMDKSSIYCNLQYVRWILFLDCYIFIFFII